MPEGREIVFLRSFVAFYRDLPTFRVFFPFFSTFLQILRDFRDFPTRFFVRRFEINAVSAAPNYIC